MTTLALAGILGSAAGDKAVANIFPHSVTSDCINGEIWHYDVGWFGQIRNEIIIKC
ncbi:hypothetical protein [Hymenobacter guriensis]|uniref:Uncharacterized protein n=1 Tax=Hymenobacter guriensis TaxID=2793065 RepID=A0ABS0KYU8_9BACT|nr:hypothetical protein [Hymenobacter guriensis]MBG8552389.1 hypothetical protein [Hymenobacter guriensis]